MSNQLVAMKSTINSRVGLSGDLIQRMGITVEQYERYALNALVTLPALAECTSVSMDRALIAAISAGLVPDSKEAVIVPFKDKDTGQKTATLIPMIEGRLKLARKATPGIVFRVRVVYRGDKWEYAEGLRATLIHVPDPTANRSPEEIIAAYAIAHIPGAVEPEFEVMFRGDIDRIKTRSPGRGSGPWATHYAEQAKKTVLGPLLKRLPKAVGSPADPPSELVGYEVDSGIPEGAIDVTPPENPEPEPPEPEKEPVPPKKQTRQRQTSKPNQNRQNQNAPPANNEPPIDEEPPAFESPFA